MIKYERRKPVIIQLDWIIQGVKKQKKGNKIGDNKKKWSKKTEE